MFLAIFLVLCFLAGMAASGRWLKLAQARHWFDYPNQRSSHIRATPKSGGVGFALVFFTVLIFFSWRNLISAEQLWLCIPGLGLAVSGFLDDIGDLGILQRIGVQSVAVIAGLWILPGLPWLVLPGISLDNSILMLLVLSIGWLWLINLYNFMDGIDGLAAIEGVFVALALGWFALAAGLHGSGLLMLALAAILGGFLCFNWAPARLFMGDAGSNFLGYVLPAYALMLVLNGAITLWTFIILLAVFVSDSTLTLLKRIRARLVWYHGHRSHAYQLLARTAYGHDGVVVGVTAINMVWLLPLAWLSLRYQDWGWLLTLVAYVPVLLLVHRCHARYLSSGME